MGAVRPLPNKWNLTVERDEMDKTEQLENAEREARSLMSGKGR